MSRVPDPVENPTPSIQSTAGENGQGAVCRIATLLDALECGAYLMDREARFVYVNRRLCDMMQKSRGELIGRSLFELYPEGAGRQTIQDEVDHFNDPGQREFYLPGPHGAPLPVIISGRHFNGEASLGDFRIVTVIDISPQKRFERELQERYRDIATLSDTVLEQALELKRHSRVLEDRVHERTLELHKANMEAVYMLAVASEAKDLDTGAHVRRIEHYTRQLALELGRSEKEAERIGHSAILHDVGKIHVPDEVLRKPGPLSELEWTIMRQHTVAGERILSREPFFEVARSIARSHHENWDGSGYPDGLRGTDIPLPARIVRVADVYDALLSTRPYKQAWSREQAEAAIATDERSFDPDVVRSFLNLVRSGRLLPPE
jgi:putative two-component system response regulator